MLLLDDDTDDRLEDEDTDDEDELLNDEPLEADEIPADARLCDDGEDGLLDDDDSADCELRLDDSLDAELTLLELVLLLELELPLDTLLRLLLEELETVPEPRSGLNVTLAQSMQLKH